MDQRLPEGVGCSTVLERPCNSHQEGSDRFRLGPGRYQCRQRLFCRAVRIAEQEGLGFSDGELAEQIGGSFGRTSREQVPPHAQEDHGPLMGIPRSCLFCRCQTVGDALLCHRQDGGGVVLCGEFGSVVHRAVGVHLLKCESDLAVETRSPVGVQLVIERVPHDGVGKVIGRRLSRGANEPGLERLVKAIEQRLL